MTSQHGIGRRMCASTATTALLLVCHNLVVQSMALHLARQLTAVSREAGDSIGSSRADFVLMHSWREDDRVDCQSNRGTHPVLLIMRTRFSSNRLVARIRHMCTANLRSQRAGSQAHSCI